MVHRSGGNQFERSYFKVDVTKISEENHIIMENVLKDLTPEHFNNFISLTLPTTNFYKITNIFIKLQINAKKVLQN